jgi:cation diffusion facilitator family transporter
MVIQK